MLWKKFCAYLQCTTIGPASGGLQVLTRRRKAKNGVGCSGTPWSGQAVNWNCLTSLFSLEPFYEIKKLHDKTVTWYDIGTFQWNNCTACIPVKCNEIRFEARDKWNSLYGGKCLLYSKLQDLNNARVLTILHINVSQQVPELQWVLLSAK